MVNYLSSKFGLAVEFVERQIEGKSISKCFPELMLKRYVEQSGQDNFNNVEELKLGIDEMFLEYLDDEVKQLENLKEIVTTIESGHVLEDASGEQPEVNVLPAIYDPSLSEAYAKGRRRKYVEGRFCDKFTTANLKEKLLNTPKKLWGKLIFEGAITIMFSDNGVGKSQTTMMVADGIAREEPEIFGLKVDHSDIQRVVVYYDFEMSDALVLKRYGFSMDSNLNGITESELKSMLPQFVRVDHSILRAELLAFGVDEDELNSRSAIQLLLVHMKYCLEHKYPDCKVIFVVDNITSVCYKTEENSVAQELMNSFIKYKQEYGTRFTLLLLAHTPKVPKEKPLAKEHLKGAKSLSDLADEVLGLKQSSQDENYFYLKQLKGRIDGIDFNEDKVLVFRRFTTASGALSLEVIKCEEEYLHIKTENDAKREIDNANQRLADSFGEFFVRTFKPLTSFPEGILMEERVDYLFNSTEISDILNEAFGIVVTTRQITSFLNEMKVLFVTQKIGKDKTKKGFLLERILSDLAA